MLIVLPVVWHMWILLYPEDPTAIANSYGAPVAFRAEVIDQQDKDAASVLRITPLEPLEGATRYFGIPNKWYLRI